MRKVTMSRLFVLGLILALWSGAAQAEPWIFTVGVQGGETPPYEGANRYAFQPTPTFDLRSANAPYHFMPPDDGSDITLYSNPYFDIGPVARFHYDRDPTGALRGFNKVQWAAEPGLFMDAWPVTWLRGRVEMRKGVTGHLGWVGDADLDLVYQRGLWDLSLGPRYGFGDKRYMETYFGVTPQDVARSPFINTVYTPKGGERYTGLEAAVSYRFTRNWRATYGIGYQRLADNAADSPIVRRVGSADQFQTTLGISYSFHVGH